MCRAFSPLVSEVRLPGASPQAGILRAGGPFLLIFLIVLCREKLNRQVADEKFAAWLLGICGFQHAGGLDNILERPGAMMRFLHAVSV